MHSPVKVLSIIGTRPEAIKMAPVVLELDRRPDEFQSVVCGTGQHREMLDQALAIFEIEKDVDLEVMTENQSLPKLTSKLFSGLDDVIVGTKPDWILAQGDTTTVMAASITAYYHRVKFGHVEAGLRTHDRFNPFPEEVNRVIADHIADLMFAPTERSKAELLKEGLSEERILVTGNTVVDAMMAALEKPYDFSTGPLAGLPIDEKRLVVITSHRRESFGDTFEGICKALRRLAERFADEGVHLIYPVHLNPNVQKPVYEILSGIDNVSLMEPIDYLSLQNLMRRADLILTDSGGIQEEAPSVDVPVLVMRETTERPEGVDAGAVKLIGTDPNTIFTESVRILTDPKAAAAMAEIPNPYGDGKAAKRIVDALTG